MINKESIDSLLSSGLIDAYEYVLRKLVQADLPMENYYEKCAFYLIEYQKLVLEDNLRTKNLKNFLAMNEEPKQIQQEKKLREIIPNYKVILKSSMMLENEENIKVEDRPLMEMNIGDMINCHIEQSSEKVRKTLEDRPLKYKESFSAYVTEENNKLRSFIFKTAPKFKTFEFTPILEVSKMNKDRNTIELIEQQQARELNDDWSASDLGAKVVSKDFVSDVFKTSKPI